MKRALLSERDDDEGDLGGGKRVGWKWWGLLGLKGEGVDGWW